MKKLIKKSMRKIQTKIILIFSSKKFGIVISFFVGLIMGYYFGSIELHRFLNNSFSRISINFSWLKKLGEISPNVSFLSDVAVFEAAIIAFLIPLSIEIVSKLSERYQSDVIIRTFENSFENKYLPKFLLINIVFAISLRFFSDEYSPDNLIWKITAWIILLAFIFIAILILKVIKRIKLFMRDTQSVIDQLFQEIESALE